MEQTNFDVFSVVIYNILNDLENRKSRGQNNYSYVFFRQNYEIYEQNDD